VIVIGVPLLWIVLRMTGREGRRNRLRWAITCRLSGRSFGEASRALVRPAPRCGFIRNGPAAAIELASEATGSPALIRDGAGLSQQLQAGSRSKAPVMHFLPGEHPATIQFASGFNDLRATLEALADMCQRQAELRVAASPRS